MWEFEPAAAGSWWVAEQFVEINQTTLAALSMATIASFVDGPGLGRPVLDGLRINDVGKGLVPGLLMGTGLMGKTLGIVGFGRIGRQVARYAQAFGMRVLVNQQEP